MDDKPTMATSESRIHCFIDGVTRTELLTIHQRSGYPVRSNLVVEIYPNGQLRKNCGFDNEADFLAEHQYVASIAKSINPAATVRSFYYPANEETSLYRQQ